VADGVALNPADPPILLFDGECGFCQGSVRFVAKRDVRGEIRFLPLASPAGQALLSASGVDNPGDTIVLLAGGQVHLRSSAVVALLERLPGWRPAARLLRWVPTPLRDAGYRGVAAVRRRLLPPPSACPLPDPEVAARILPGGGLGRDGE